MARKINHRKNLATHLESALVSLKALLEEGANKEAPASALVKKTRRGRKASV